MEEQLDTSKIIDIIDYEKLSELLSNEKFLAQFLKSIPKNDKEQTDMKMPDLDILFEKEK
jgi:hypothetical protein